MNSVQPKINHFNSADQPRKVLQNDTADNIERNAVVTDQQPRGDDKSGPVRELTLESAKSSIESFNNFINTSLKTIRFKIDQASEKVVIQVFDTSTNEVIRQIPTEKILDLSLSFDSLKGILVDEVS